MLLPSLTIILLATLSADATFEPVNDGTGPPCCPGNNVYNVTARSCAGLKGGAVARKLVTCPHGTYVLNPAIDDMDVFSIKQGHLIMQYDVDESNGITPEKFCVTKFSDQNSTVAMVCFPDPAEKSFVTNVVCSMTSVVFILATLIVYCVVPDLRDLQGKCLMGAIFSLAVAFIVLSIVQTFSGHLNRAECATSGFFLYFWMMATFFWLNVVSINVWRTVRNKVSSISESRLFYIYCLYAWGVSFIFLVIVVIAQHMPGGHPNPGFGMEKCWFQGVTENWVYFYGPIVILLACNVVLYTMTIIKLWRDHKDFTSMSKLRSHRYKCLLYMKLFVVMGLCWIFEPLSYYVLEGRESTLFWTITDYVNLLQGVFIFILLVLSRKRALRGLARSNVCGFRCAPAYCATQADDECDEIIDDEAGLAQTTMPVTVEPK